MTTARFERDAVETHGMGVQDDFDPCRSAWLRRRHERNHDGHRSLLVALRGCILGFRALEAAENDQR
jgi:hypothetical protein